MGNIPRHVAIVMDGNGRWASKRFLPRVEGHRQGAKTVRMVVEECRKRGIRYLTLYAFSSENWQRPAEEVSALMSLFMRYLESEVSELASKGVRLRAIGDFSRLPAKVNQLLASAQEKTKDCQALDLILAVSYGAREEIVQACQKIATQVQTSHLDPNNIDDKLFASYLYAPDVPDPDLLIRTSNEFRISNFLLWQIAYSEIVITPVFWPEFSANDFAACLEQYSQRQRRFGKTAEQL